MAEWQICGLFFIIMVIFFRHAALDGKTIFLEVMIVMIMIRLEVNLTMMISFD